MVQKHVNLVDLVKSFPTNIYLQSLASIQKRTSPVKFAHLAEKSAKSSISNLSTKVRAARLRDAHGVLERLELAQEDLERVPVREWTWSQNKKSGRSKGQE